VVDDARRADPEVQVKDPGLIARSRGGIFLAGLDDTGHQAQAHDHERPRDDPDLTDPQTGCAVRQPGNNQQRPDQVHDHVSHRTPRNWTDCKEAAAESPERWQVDKLVACFLELCVDQLSRRTAARILESFAGVGSGRNMTYAGIAGMAHETSGCTSLPQAHGRRALAGEVEVEKRRVLRHTERRVSADPLAARLA